MKPFHPIVLLTDFSLKDIYVASIKGVILSLFPEATMVDLSHEIEPQNVRQAAFCLEASYSLFPTGSIFVCVVDPGVGSERSILAAKTKKGIFLAPDNGLLTRVLEKEKPFELRIATNRKFFRKEISHTFHGRDCFAPLAARLAMNPVLFSGLGPKVRNFHRLDSPKPKIRKGKVSGEVLFFDHFGNAFTNIPGTVPSSSFSVRVKGKNLGSIRKSYFEVPQGKAVAVISSSNWLELAVNHGSAREKLKLREGTCVEVY